MRAALVLLAVAVVATHAINVKTLKHHLDADVDADADADAAAGATVDVSSAAAALAHGQFSVSADSIKARSATTGPPVPCAGRPSPGLCIDIDNFSCTNGKLLTGKCAGDNTVLCCTGQPVETPVVVAARIPTDPFPVKPPAAQPAPLDRAVAFKATLTPAGLGSLNVLLNKVLQKQLAKPILIPDQALTLDTDQLGTFTLNVKNLALHDLAIGPVAVTTSAPANVVATVRGGNAKADLDFDWKRTKFPRVGGDGHLQVGVTDLSVGFTLALATANSRLGLTMSAATVTIDKLNFRFSKSWDSFVLNAITSLFMAKLKPLIQTAVSTGVVAPFNAQIKTILDALPTATTFPAGDMKCSVRIGFEQATAGADGLTLGESFSIDCE